jgi:hypothetical protein
MKLYFHTRQLPGLADLPLSERLTRIQHAEKRLTSPEKLLLNVIKLLIIIPFFVLILRTGEDLWSLAWAFLVVLTYPILLKPIHYSLCAKYLAKQHKQGD